jgi:hypothetical protein
VTARSLGDAYDRLVFNRAVLFWAHLLLGAAVCLVYLSTLDMRHLAYWRTGAGAAAILRAAGPIFPYCVSAILSRSVVTASRTHAWTYVLFLTAITIVVGLAYMTGYTHRLGPLGTTLTVIVQVLVISVALRACFPAFNDLTGPNR